jgi:hypothetical protein
MKYSITYCKGPVLYFSVEVSVMIHIDICEELTERFTKELCRKGEKYIFQPEPIFEGGFKMVQFPGKKDKMIKTILYQERTQECKCINWPWSKSDTVVKRKDDLIPLGFYSDTILKAFYGAPIWTVEEIRLFSETLLKYGIKCTKLPSEKQLSFNAG